MSGIVNKPSRAVACCNTIDPAKNLERTLNRIQILTEGNPVKNAERIRNNKLLAMALSVIAFIQHALFFIPGQIIIKPILYLVIDWKKVAAQGPQSCVENIYEDYLSKGFVLSGLKVIAAAISIFMTIFVGGIASNTCFDYHVDLGLIKDQRPRPMAKRDPEVAPIGPEEGTKRKSDSYWTAREMEDFGNSAEEETTGSAGKQAGSKEKEKDRKVASGELDVKHRAESTPSTVASADVLSGVDPDAV